MTLARIVAGQWRTYEADAFEDVLRDYWSRPGLTKCPDEFVEAVLENGTVPDVWGPTDSSLNGKIRATAWTAAREDGQGYIVLANLVEVDYPVDRFKHIRTASSLAEVAEVFAIYEVSEDRRHAEPLEEWTGLLQAELTADCGYLLQPVMQDTDLHRETWTQAGEGAWVNERGEMELDARVSPETLQQLAEKFPGYQIGELRTSDRIAAAI